jgi:hypothetical protein
MPRESDGTYNLPAGNPVASGTPIESSWANSTMDDLELAMTNSLSRDGEGGMLADMPFVDGTQTEPGMTWTNEITTGIWRAAAGDMQVALLGQPVMRWNNSVTSVWDGAAWQDIVYKGSAGSTPSGTTDGDTLVWDETTTQKWVAVAASILPTVVDQGTSAD